MNHRIHPKIDRALDNYQPLHRINLVVCTMIGTAGVVINLLGRIWWIALVAAVSAYVMRYCIDQLLLHWCLYRECPTWTPDQRRRQYTFARGAL